MSVLYLLIYLLEHSPSSNFQMLFLGEMNIFDSYFTVNCFHNTVNCFHNSKNSYVKVEIIVTCKKLFM